MPPDLIRSVLQHHLSSSDSPSVPGKLPAGSAQSPTSPCHGLYTATTPQGTALFPVVSWPCTGRDKAKLGTVHCLPGASRVLMGSLMKRGGAEALTGSGPGAFLITRVTHLHSM